MQPYIYIYVFTLLLFIIAFNKPQYKSRCFSIAAISIWLLISLRTELVGTDTITYYNFFKSPDLLYNDSVTDSGFMLIAIFFRFLYVPLNLFIFFITTFYLYGVYFIIKKLSNYKTLSLVLFLIMGTTSVFSMQYMSMTRQCCSISVFLVAVYLLFSYRKEKIYLASLLYIFAVSIHGSMLFTLPFILLCYFFDTPSKKSIYIVIIGTYLVAGFNIFPVSSLIDTIIDMAGGLVTRDYSAYGQELTFGVIENKGLFNMFLLPFTAISITLTYFSNLRYLNIWYVKFFLISTVLTNLLYDNLMWGRLVFPFTLFSIIAVPNLLKFLKPYQKKIFITLVIMYFTYKSYNLLVYISLIGKSVNTIVPYDSILL